MLWKVEEKDGGLWLGRREKEGMLPFLWGWEWISTG